MPTYDYKCTKCEQKFEVIQSIKDEPLTTCLLCQAQGTVKKLISKNVGIAFNGSGFYVTDSKKTAKTTSAS